MDVDSIPVSVASTLDFAFLFGVLGAMTGVEGAVSLGVVAEVAANKPLPTVSDVATLSIVVSFV